MTTSLEAALANSWPVNRWRDVGVVVAVSGGCDSVSLLRAMVNLARQAQHGSEWGGENWSNLCAAHFNHGLRSTADVDEQFVRELAASLKVECEVGHAETNLAVDAPDGIEAAARQHRYNFLASVAARRGARYVVTAHTADDQAETVLHRVIRGTGLSGLAGIPETRELSPGVTLIRPLLGIRRSKCEAYLAALNQPYRTDESNNDPTFTRNRIRHELVPLLCSFNESIVDSLNRLADLAGDANDVISSEVEQRLADARFTRNGVSVELDCFQLQDVSDFVLRELLIQVWKEQQWPQQHMSYEKWSELATMTTHATQPSQICLPGNVVARRQGRSLRLTRNV